MAPRSKLAESNRVPTRFVHVNRHKRRRVLLPAKRSHSESDWSTEESDSGVHDDPNGSSSDARPAVAKGNAAESHLASSTLGQDVANDPFSILEQLHDGHDPLRGDGFPSRGRLCELHTYDSREDARGETHVLRAGTKFDFEDQADKSPDAALVLWRYFNEDNHLTLTRLEVKSAHIKLALREVLGDQWELESGPYGDLFLVGRPRYLFHKRKELEVYAESLQDEEARTHVNFCIKYINRCFQKEISAFEDLMRPMIDLPLVDFERLWMAFKPGELIYFVVNGVDHVARLKELDEQGNGILSTTKTWSLTMRQIEYDGKELGLVTVKATIRHFEGMRAIIDLEAFPLRYHCQATELKQRLVARGKQYTASLGIHYRRYNGPAYLMPLGAVLVQRDINVLLKAQVQERAMIDFEGVRFHPNCGVTLLGGTVIKRKAGSPPDLTEDELAVCCPFVPGFVLVTKKWGYFDISKFEEIDFDESIFRKLVLPQQIKDVVSSVVSRKNNDKALFDDLIEGKGKGIIFLLQGPPGVGKTFTAESVAELTHRPLYIIDFGDFGHSIHGAELALSQTLDVATRWNAIILIDEADVFLEARKIDQLSRNSLVSIMLRTLEYFRGILFMTTNRVEVIDPAFKSRIHFTIAYPQLSQFSRRELWRTLALQGQVDQDPVWLTDGFLDRVASVELNGRQIKNATRIANSLAASADRPLDAEDFYTVLEILETFEIGFEREVEQAQTDKGQSNKTSNEEAQKCEDVLPIYEADPDKQEKTWFSGFTHNDIESK